MGIEFRPNRFASDAVDTAGAVTLEEVKDATRDKVEADPTLLANKDEARRRKAAGRANFGRRQSILGGGQRPTSRKPVLGGQ